MRLAAKGFTAILSIITVGAALSLTTPLRIRGRRRQQQERHRGRDRPRTGAAAEEAVTRGLSIAPQADPAPSATETKLIQSVRGRSTRSLSSTEREEIAVGGQGQAEHRS